MSINATDATGKACATCARADARLTVADLLAERWLIRPYFVRNERPIVRLAHGARTGRTEKPLSCILRDDPQGAVPFSAIRVGITGAASRTAFPITSSARWILETLPSRSTRLSDGRQTTERRENVRIPTYLGARPFVMEVSIVVRLIPCRRRLIPNCRSASFAFKPNSTWPGDVEVQLHDSEKHAIGLIPTPQLAFPPHRRRNCQAESQWTPQDVRSRLSNFTFAGNMECDPRTGRA